MRCRRSAISATLGDVIEISSMASRTSLRAEAVHRKEVLLLGVVGVVVLRFIKALLLSDGSLTFPVSEKATSQKDSPIEPEPSDCPLTPWKENSHFNSHNRTQRRPVVLSIRTVTANQANKQVASEGGCIWYIDGRVAIKGNPLNSQL